MYTLTDPNNPLTIATLLVIAAFLHASFQLGVSVMTMLSGHALGQKHSHARLLKLCLSYIAGCAVVTFVLLLDAFYVMSAIEQDDALLWVVVAAISIAMGLVTALFYFRPKSGLYWVPQTTLNYLYDRTRKTKSATEAFSLGIITSIVELPFVIAPLLLVAMLLRGNPSFANVGGALGYVFIACLPLLVMFVLLGSGKKISALERWRESQKRFLQVTSGIGLAAIGIYAFALFGVAS